MGNKIITNPVTGKKLVVSESGSIIGKGTTNSNAIKDSKKSSSGGSSSSGSSKNNKTVIDDGKGGRYEVWDNNNGKVTTYHYDNSGKFIASVTTDAKDVGSKGFSDVTKIMSGSEKSYETKDGNVVGGAVENKQELKDKWSKITGSELPTWVNENYDVYKWKSIDDINKTLEVRNKVGKDFEENVNPKILSELKRREKIDNPMIAGVDSITGKDTREIMEKEGGLMTSEVPNSKGEMVQAPIILRTGEGQYEPLTEKKYEEIFKDYQHREGEAVSKGMEFFNNGGIGEKFLGRFLSLTHEGNTAGKNPAVRTALTSGNEKAGNIQEFYREIGYGMDDLNSRAREKGYADWDNAPYSTRELILLERLKDSTWARTTGTEVVIGAVTGGLYSGATEGLRIATTGTKLARGTNTALKLIDTAMLGGLAVAEGKTAYDIYKAPTMSEKVDIAGGNVESLAWGFTGFNIGSGVVGGIMRKARSIKEREVNLNRAREELVKKFGEKSGEVIDFDVARDILYKQLPRKTKTVKDWSPEYVKEIAGDKKLIKITKEVVQKHAKDLKIIGSTTISSTAGIKPAKGYSGDVDISQVKAEGSKFDYKNPKMDTVMEMKNKDFIIDLYGRLKAEGYNVNLNAVSDNLGPGNALHLNLNGREFVNAHENALEWTYGQIRKNTNLFDWTADAWVRDTRGVQMLNLRDQARTKFYAGYVEGGSRAKDIPDALAVAEAVAEGKIKFGNIKNLRSWNGIGERSVYYDLAKMDQTTREAMENLYQKGKLEKVKEYKDGRWETTGYKEHSYDYSFLQKEYGRYAPAYGKGYSKQRSNYYRIEKVENQKPYVYKAENYGKAGYVKRPVIYPKEIYLKQRGSYYPKGSKYEYERDYIKEPGAYYDKPSRYDMQVSKIERENPMLIDWSPKKDKDERESLKRMIKKKVRSFQDPLKRITGKARYSFKWNEFMHKGGKGEGLYL